MATTDKQDLRREAIRRMLAQGARTQGAAGRPSSGAIATASAAIWTQVGQCLVPMIGTRGVDALFGRALQLTAATIPWLAAGLEYEDGSGPLANAMARLADRDPDAAEAASLVLLVTFTSLLATLIGEPLTDRLLDPVWGTPAPESALETQP
jgi:hypothetical protein